MAKYGAVTYFDDGISVLTHDDLTVLLGDLCQILITGQEGYMYGLCINPDTFEAEVKQIIEDMGKSEFEDIATAIMEKITGAEEAENLPSMIIQISE